jgi:HEAT repeat protein
MIARHDDVTARLEALMPSQAPPPENRFARTHGQEPADLEELCAHLTDADPGARADAAERLGRLRASGVVEALRARLEDDDAEARTQAAVALLRIGDDVLFPEVVKALRHRDPQVVIGAAVALAHLGDTRVVPNLVEAFKTDDPELGNVIAWALGRLGDAAALPWLVTAIEQGFAMAASCEALGMLNDARAAPVLVRMLRAAHSEVRAQAALALSRVPYADDDTWTRAILGLRALLQDPASPARVCAVSSLLALGDTIPDDDIASALGER